MKRFWNCFHHHPIGIYAQIGSSLSLLVFVIFTYMSVTGCEGSPPQNQGCGSPSGGSSNTNSEYQVTPVSGQATLTQGGMRKGVSTTSSTPPGSQAARLLGWTGTQPDKLTWTPPPGSTGFTFSDPSKQPQAGGPPFTFVNPAHSIPLQFRMPNLPAGQTSMKVTETLEYSSTLGSSYTSLVTLLQTLSSGSSNDLPGLPVAHQIDPQNSGTDVYVLLLERWIDYNGITMDTARCQQITDWFQSPNAFVAMRVPVFAVAPGNPSFVLPVLFPASTEKRPQLELQGYQPTPQNLSIVNIPMELRPERMTYAENNLPASTGQQWVTMGATQSPKTTCPAIPNYTNWSYRISLPADLYDKGTNEILLYFCQEGQEAPPFAQAALLLERLRTPYRANSGITCIGPQTHRLLLGGIKMANPLVEWDIQPPKEIKLRKLVEIFETLPVSLNFSIDSQVTGADWKLYEANQAGTGPDTSKQISSPFQFTLGYTDIWLVGTIPSGTAAGPYNVKLTATLAGTPATTDSITDILWVGDWVAPPAPKTLYLPIIQK